MNKQDKKTKKTWKVRITCHYFEILIKIIFFFNKKKMAVIKQKKNLDF